MANPKEKTIERVNKLIEMVTEGYQPSEALKELRMSRSTLHEVLEHDPHISRQYSRAHTIALEASIEDMEKIASDKTIDPQRAKNMLDVRKWRASKLNPTKYGDRIEVNVNQSVDISLALKESLERVIEVMPNTTAITQNDSINESEESNDDTTNGVQQNDQSLNKSNS